MYPPVRSAIVVFPGTNRERDVAIALQRATGQRPAILWHKETTLPPLDLLILPGGFSHGDYLRCGAMAAHSPIMPAIHAFVAKGGHVMGICNGFQILTEAGLLPGALLHNARLRFLSQDCHLRVERNDTVYTRHYQTGQTFRAPLAHGDGQLQRRRRNPGPPGRRGEGGLPLRRPRRHLAGQRQPQRLRPRHRRALQRQPARARPDAPRPRTWSTRSPAAPTAPPSSAAWSRGSQHEQARRRQPRPRVRPQHRGI